MSLQKNICLLALLILFSGCGATFNGGHINPESTVRMKLESTINGLRRTAQVHIPSDYNMEEAYPLVVVIHGAFSTAEQMEKETGFSKLADKEGFVVMYPNGMGIFGLLQHWNAGHCCGKAAKDGIDDVAFIDECIDTLSQRVRIDPQRIYVTGFSNGGMLAFLYAELRSDRVAAIASLGASVGGRATWEEEWWYPERPVRPVPLLIVHGAEDDAVPLEGGASPRKGGPRQYISLYDSIGFWLLANGCSWEAEKKEQYVAGVHKQQWTQCANGAEVVAYVLDGWNHRWPGPYFISENDALAGFDISKVIWDFFCDLNVDPCFLTSLLILLANSQ